MDISEDMIRKGALARIAEVFGVSISDLNRGAKFGIDLKASFVSRLKYNEYDRIDQDIRDVSDRKIARELSSGRLTICTVGDYCDHMVRCFKTKPNDVRLILNL